MYRIMWAHFNTYLDYMPISCRCYFGKDQLKANGLVYHSNVKAKNNQTLVTCDLIHSRNPRAGHFCHRCVNIRKFQWIFQVPVKGGRDYITP